MYSKVLLLHTMNDIIFHDWKTEFAMSIVSWTINVEKFIGECEVCST